MRRLGLRGLVAACLGMALWLGCWHAWVGAAWFCGAAWLVAHDGRRRWAVVWGVLGLIAVPICVVDYDRRSSDRMQQVWAHGSDVLGTHDLVAIYGLNVFMGGTGLLLGFPEVAAETLLLAVPSDGERVWNSGRFPVCAPKVAKVVQGHRRALSRGRKRASTAVVWSGYGIGGDSVRAALALNPVTVVSTLVDGQMMVEASVPVDYPPRHRLVLGEVAGLHIAVEEGLFHALQERGWLHPYTLTYRSQIPLDGPFPTTCEAWSVRVARLLN